MTKLLIIALIILSVSYFPLAYFIFESFRRATKRPPETKNLWFKFLLGPKGNWRISFEKPGLVGLAEVICFLWIVSLPLSIIAWLFYGFLIIFKKVGKFFRGVGALIAFLWGVIGYGLGKEKEKENFY